MQLRVELKKRKCTREREQPESVGEEKKKETSPPELEEKIHPFFVGGRSISVWHSRVCLLMIIFLRAVFRE